MLISTGRPVTECRRELELNPETVDTGVARRQRELEMENAFLKRT